MSDVKKSLAYAGRRLSTKNATLYVYAPLDGGDQLLYSKTLRAGTPIGAILEITFTDDGRVYTGGENRPKIVDSASDESELAAWTAADKITSVQLADIAREKRIAKNVPDPLTDALDVLRAAMREQRGIGQKAALERYITTYIHN